MSSMLTATDVNVLSEETVWSYELRSKDFIYGTTDFSLTPMPITTTIKISKPLLLGLILLMV